MRAPLPADEDARLSALRTYAILDTPPEPAFDEITWLATRICDAPTAMLTLVDARRQWFKSHRGWDLAETHRDLSFCAYTILSVDLMVVPDATQDERFADNPLVTGAPHIRFYAGVPLVDDHGYALGTLAALDYTPRTLTDDQRLGLSALARQAVTQLSLRRRLLEERRAGEESLGEVERRLRVVESRHRRLVESNVIGVVVSGAGGRIEEANDRFLGFVGYTVEDVASGGLRWDMITPPESPEARRQLREEVLRAGASPPRERELVHRDGHRVPVLVAMAVLEGGPDNFIFVVDDLTELKRAEQQRRKLEAQVQEAQKLEAIGQLAGGVAHDFNNILATVLGNVELARMDVPTDHPARESLDEIERAGERAKALVRQILDFGRRRPPKRRVISLRPVLDEVLTLLRAAIPPNVELAARYPNTLPNVFADETQVYQALLNVCTNAWHALEGGPGRIEIQVSATTVDSAFARRHPGLREGRYVRVRVSDTGKGMDSATLEHVFEPFFTTKPPGLGTGLGLSVVHGVMRGHEGGIAVTSTPGLGTTFDLYFPVSVAVPRAASPVGPPVCPPRGRGRHVLYLDDEEPLVLLVTRVLERRGYRVSGFTRPADALAALRADPSAFDLLVTDFNMPGTSGLDVAAESARLRPDLPVAIASGYVTDDLREKAVRVGVRQLIHKPQTVEELCTLIDGLTDKPRKK